MSNNIVTLKSGSEVTQGHRNRHGSIRTYDFLLTFYSNHGSISYRFRDRRRFQSKVDKKISHPVYFAPQLTGFPIPLELGIGEGVRKPE